jgi:hypothetical protein
LFSLKLSPEDGSDIFRDTWVDFPQITGRYVPADRTFDRLLSEDLKSVIIKRKLVRIKECKATEMGNVFIVNYKTS